MKKAIVFCLLAFALSLAQKQRVVVLPSIAAPEVKLSAEELDVLTNRLRSITTNVLPLNDFILLRQDFVRDHLGDEDFFRVCQE